MDSWASSACYPRRTFYPLSDGPSTQNHRITMTDFRLCSARRPRSQAGLCHCTQQLISDQLEPTFARLRYPLGGDRPSQTARQPPSPTRLTASGERSAPARVVFHRRLRHPREGALPGSHLSYASWRAPRWQAAVKLHGVFLSCCGVAASSQPLQFRRGLRRDSAQIVTPFVRVGTYPTRNFATLGPL